MTAGVANADSLRLDFNADPTTGANAVQVCMGNLCTGFSFFDCEEGGTECWVNVDRGEQMTIRFGQMDTEGAIQLVSPFTAGNRIPPRPATALCKADVDGDGFVLGTDFALLTENFNKGACLNPIPVKE